MEANHIMHCERIEIDASIDDDTTHSPQQSEIMVDIIVRNIKGGTGSIISECPYAPCSILS